MPRTARRPTCAHAAMCHRARLRVRLDSPAAPGGHLRLALPGRPARLRLLRLKSGHPGQLVIGLLDWLSKKLRDEASPALVRRPYTAAGVAVEVLVEQRVVAEMWVATKPLT